MMHPIDVSICMLRCASPTEKILRHRTLPKAFVATSSLSTSVCSCVDCTAPDWPTAAAAPRLLERHRAAWPCSDGAAKADQPRSEVRLVAKLCVPL